MSVPISTWMLITTLCLSLYLAAIKRRQELSESGSGGRMILNYYSVPLLSCYAEFAAMCSIAFYGLFVIEVRPRLALSIPLVIFGFFRYGYIVERQGAGESPTDALWSDMQLVLAVLAWIGLSLYALWPT